MVEIPSTNNIDKKMSSSDDSELSITQSEL